MIPELFHKHILANADYYNKRFENNFHLQIELRFGRDVVSFYRKEFEDLLATSQPNNDEDAAANFKMQLAAGVKWSPMGEPEELPDVHPGFITGKEENYQNILEQLDLYVLKKREGFSKYRIERDSIMPCKHKWKATPGLFRTYEDCVHCGIKKEEVL